MSCLQQGKNLGLPDAIDDIVDYFNDRASWKTLILLDKSLLRQRTLTHVFQGSNPCSPAKQGLPCEAGVALLMKNPGRKLPGSLILFSAAGNL